MFKKVNNQKQLMADIDYNIIEINDIYGNIIEIDLNKISEDKGGCKIYTVLELKDILRRLNISTTGNKQILVYNLLLYLYQQQYIDDEPTKPIITKSKPKDVQRYVPKLDRQVSENLITSNNDINPEDLDCIPSGDIIILERSNDETNEGDSYNIIENESLLPECDFLIKKLEYTNMPITLEPKQIAIY